MKSNKKEYDKLPWWIRFQLFFKNPVCSWDWGGDILYVVCIKKLRGIHYIIDCGEVVSIATYKKFRKERNASK